MGENVKRLVTFNVTVEIDPAAFADEYGTDQSASADAREAAATAFGMLSDRMLHSVTVRGVTLPSFAENNGHWATVHVSEHELLPVHRDGLAPGTRNPYNTDENSEFCGMFKALCVCGEVFWGLDPQDADSKMMDHCERENHEARPDDSPVRLNRCAECGAAIESTGPDSWRHKG